VGRAPRSGRTRRRGGAALRLNASVVSSAVALLALVWSLAVVPMHLDGKAYYEILFWGVGHALQFTWTLAMLVACCGWRSLRRTHRAEPRVVLGCSRWRWSACSSRPMPTWRTMSPSVEHRALHTWAMRSAAASRSSRWRWPWRWRCCRCAGCPPSTAAARALWSSMGLFAAGGLIGLLIGGSNVTFRRITTAASSA